MLKLFAWFDIFELDNIKPMQLKIIIKLTVYLSCNICTLTFTKHILHLAEDFIFIPVGVKIKHRQNTSGNTNAHKHIGAIVYMLIISIRKVIFSPLHVHFSYIV